ncbi:MAG: hypothetical protein ACTSSP_02840 [Candidatus Asgardarchaeia archaeon]
MRVSAEIISEQGERVTPHSKFYIWDDRLFEPAIYRGRPTKTYKAIADPDRIKKILARRRNKESIPTISSVCPSLNKRGSHKKSSKVVSRYEILDL